MSGAAAERLSRAEVTALIAECKARIRLSDIIGRDVKLKRAGRENIGLSPFTHERTPSFTVNDARGFYHCFSSGRHGDLISWLQERQSLSFWDALTEARRLAGLEAGPLSAAQVQFRQQANQRKRESREAYQARMMDYARGLWDAARPAQNSPVETYLSAARGIDLGRIGGIPPIIRFHPAVKNKSGEIMPVMAARIDDRNGDFTGLHITFLKPGGRGKIDAPKGGRRVSKQILGAYFGGAARLITPSGDPAQTLSVGEGIESVLSAYQLYVEGPDSAAGLWWAALSLGNLTGAQARDAYNRPQFAHTVRKRDGAAAPQTRVPVPDPDRPGFLPPQGFSGAVRCLCEDDLKDNPKSGLSGTQRAQEAYALACAKFRRFGAARTVNSWPPKGCDFNDVLLQRADAEKPHAASFQARQTARHDFAGQNPGPTSQYIGAAL